MLTFQKYVHFLRTQFPPGSRVLLLSNDQPRPVPDGTMGTLTEVDAAGRFLVNWDNGKRTALNLGNANSRFFKSDQMRWRLNSPLHGVLTPAMEGALLLNTTSKPPDREESPIPVFCWKKKNKLYKTP